MPDTNDCSLILSPCPLLPATPVATSRLTLSAVAHGQPLRCAGFPRCSKWRGNPLRTRRCLTNALAPPAAYLYQS
ncbi:MAG: hypothetical protein KME32_27635 [Mojavia pulchra JT2-VF2]|jgi:hypothetical protein|uniref:Uncharacterized protein n=1 Tax=Mojavia pulchra JT2-VF2 TaxID=287848 RepID=A0A951UIM8_9NOST|nr:hypothetical protein [Mojavia pulchra JT2-VF2]